MTRVSVLDGRPVTDKELRFTAAHEAEHSVIGTMLFPNSLVTAHALPTAGAISASHWKLPAASVGLNGELDPRLAVYNVALCLAPMQPGSADRAEAFDTARLLVHWPCVAQHLVERVHEIVERHRSKGDFFVGKLAEMLFDAAHTDHPDVSGDVVRSLFKTYSGWLPLYEGLRADLDHLADLVHQVAPLGNTA